ncbi:hypothetical protein [Spirillospora sp. CA-294931]|uniref:hypothetical protein n=1 Tax=Spirillospora sp. CA-294931 TaxID=3240042 RepID=UPI003D8B2891
MRNKARDLKPRPTAAQIRPEEDLLQITGALDGMGRQQFSVYWASDTPYAQGGPPDGVRGQVFHTQLDEFITTHQQRGDEVRIWAITGDAADGPLARFVERVDDWRQNRIALADHEAAGQPVSQGMWTASHDDADSIIDGVVDLLNRLPRDSRGT